MNFSWPRLCTDNHIDFVTSGPSTARGNIYVRCPWCADDNEYMGLSLNTRRPYYACWRNAEHRGKNPTRLVAALLDIAYAQAAEIVSADDHSGVDDYEAAISRVLSPRPEQAMTDEIERSLNIPDIFRPLWQEGPGSDRFLEYLSDRGFPAPTLVASRYQLHYCRVGAFAQRLVIPVFRERRLLTWTGRDITGLSELRYQTLSDKEDLAKRQGFAPALLPINSTVLNYDKAVSGGDGLVICEGPFDAIKVDWYAPSGYTAVGLFGMPKNAQLGLLTRLASRFERVYVTLDASATSNGRKLWEELEPVLGRSVRQFDVPAHDPGSLTGREVRELLGRWL